MSTTGSASGEDARRAATSRAQARYDGAPWRPAQAPRRRGDRGEAGLVDLPVPDVLLAVAPAAHRRCRGGPASDSHKVNVMPDLHVVDLSRLQFALTALYHFLFVPLTIGLALIMAIM